MQLWIEWWNQLRPLRPAFSRTRTFLWFAVALAATCVHSDLLGVSSMVRALGLQERCYDRLLDCFHRSLRRNKCSKSSSPPWLDCVVPIAMKGISKQINLRPLFIGDLASDWIPAAV